MFSGKGSSRSKGGKPFIVTETGSTFHLSIKILNENRTIPAPEGQGRLEIKQTWWRQYLNSTFLSSFPKIKAICTFEFIKFEETTWRDFTNMGDTRTGINSPFGNDGGSQAGPVLAAFRDDLQSPQIESVLIWSNQTKLELRPSSDGKDKTKNHAQSYSFSLVGIFLLFLFTLS